jgi:tetratricopeptide (TPR) repeat protein
VLTPAGFPAIIPGVVREEMVESIGERLRRLRLGRELSQRDLSSPGVSYAYISRIEAGARRPSVRALRMLALKLGVTAEYLETGSELATSEARELRLADIELRLRLEGDVEIDELRDLLADAIEHADGNATLRSRIALGFAAWTRGDLAETVEQLELAIESDLITPVSRPDVYLTLGRAYAGQGAPRRAVELFEHSLAELERLAPGDVGARVRFSSYLSFALTDLGELERARVVVTETLSGADDQVDPYTRIRLFWSLGRLSLEQSKPQAALDSFRRAVALLEATEDTLHLARAHLNCAHALLDAGDVGAAGRHIALAEELFGNRPVPDDLAVVRRMQATCAARTGDFAAAERYGAEALVLAADLPNERGQTWWALAEARAGAGDESARDAYTHAVELLAEHGTVREHANLLRSYGRYLKATGREAEALDVYERAADIAANLQGDYSPVEL